MPGERHHQQHEDVISNDLMHQNNSSTQESGQRKEIYTYEAPWTVFAMAWSHR